MHVFFIFVFAPVHTERHSRNTLIIIIIIINYLAFDSSLPSASKIFTNFLLMILVCRQGGKNHLAGLVVRHPPREGKIRDSNPAGDGIFPGRVLPVT